MYQSIFVISGVSAGLSLVVASYLSRFAPASATESILLSLSGLSFLVLFVTFLIYSVAKKFIRWVVLTIGWLVFVIHTILIINATCAANHQKLIYAGIFAFLLILILLGLAFGLFLKQYRVHRDKKSLAGMILSLLPILSFIILLLVL